MMHRRTLTLLLLLLLAICASYVVFWPNAGSQTHSSWNSLPNPFIVREGLDLQGGVRVLLVPDGPQPPLDALNTTRDQLEQRASGGLGVNEPDIRLQKTNGQYGIDVELPGLNSGDQQEAINTLLKTGKLEFWDTGQDSLPEHTAFNPAQFAQSNSGTQPLFTGADLDPASLQVSQDQQTGAGYVIEFAMKGKAFGRLSDFTAAHVGDFLTITLDRQVVSSPQIREALPGHGLIQGHFTLDEANQLVSVLKYGALPVPLSIHSEQTIGPTLGQEAIQKSEIAGMIGLGIVVLFMLLYYRLPGLLADIALLLYGLVTFALFKIIAVTLTLPGIAGFILSIGMAVDANVLIFERVKEELRAGRPLAMAIELGWKRAWPSIRDSNISTLITCTVLYSLGSNFGTTMIVGFATTLFLGVVISMFTAIIVTRTFLNLLVPTSVGSHPILFGLPAESTSAASQARRADPGARKPPATTNPPRPTM